MAQVTLTNDDFQDGETITDTKIDANFDDLKNAHNNHDSGVSAWQQMKVTATVANPVDVTSSASTTELSINNTATDGDPVVSLELSGTQKGALWVDDSDSDNIKLGRSTSSNDDLIISQSTGAVSLRGTTTNDNASTGYVGEFVESNLTQANRISAGDSVFTNITTISLTAGDWDVSGWVQFRLNGATLDDTCLGAISAFSGNTTTDHVTGANQVQGLNPTSSNESGVPIVNYRFTLSSTTTIYLKGYMGYSAGTSQIYGSIRARRRR